MSVEERLSRIERSMRRQKILGALKTLFYIIVLAGVALYLYGLYVASGEWRVEPEGLPHLGFEGPRVLVVGGNVRVYNPDGPVTAKLVYYRIYVEDQLAGDGLVPYLDLPSGWSTHRLEVKVDLARVGCGLAEALLEGGNVTVRARGYAMVDVKTWGGLTWKTVTVPFDVVLGEAGVPSLDPASKTLLEFIVGLCRGPGNLTFPGTSPAPWPSLPGPGGGDEAVRVYLDYEPAGVGLRRVIVVVENRGGEALLVYNITVNGVPAYEGTMRVPAGEAVRIATDAVLPPGSPVRAVVYTSRGEYAVNGIAG